MARDIILIVGENKDSQEQLEAILEEPYEILKAAPGEDAWRLLEENGDAISLIFLEILSSEKDGCAFLNALQNNPLYANIPVIAAAQNKSEEAEAAALSQGAADFVAKPYNAQIIRRRAANILHLKASAAMENLYQYDQLTGLHSKEYFYQCAEEILKRNPDREYDIICSDFENFKLVNEVFGRQIGDRLLRGTANLLLKTMRGKGLCAHFSSDLFVCMTEHRESYTDDLFRRIVEEVNQLTAAKNVMIKWGIYVTGSRKTTVEQMCDWALETAKSIKGQYGKYFAYYDDELRSRLLREQEITACMEDALREGQFHVWLQPK